MAHGRYARMAHLRKEINRMQERPKMKKGDKVVIDGKTYEYQEDSGSYGDQLVLYSDDSRDEILSIACPHCYSTRFGISMSFRNYECVATCKCGHRMVVYDG